MKEFVRGLALFVLFVTAGGVTAQDQPKVGDIVWAEWKPNDWYHGKVAKVDGKDYSIDFDDGDKSVVSSSKIAIDRTPKKNEVLVETRVLAKFKGVRFFPGKVTEIAGGRYNIKFDDGDIDTVNLDQLRLISK